MGGGAYATAGADCTGAGAAFSGVPQLLQNDSPAWLGVPQLAQMANDPLRRKAPSGMSIDH